MRIDWQKTASVLFCILVALGALFLIGKYIIIIVLPFLIAWGLAFSLRPTAKLLSSRTGLSLRVSSVFLLILLFSFLGVLLYFGLDRLIEELGRLIEGFSSKDSTIGQQLAAMFRELDHISDRLPFFSDSSDALRDRFDEILVSMLKDVTAKLITGITALATNLIRAIPSIMLFVAVTIIATFYFSLDLDVVHRVVTYFLPQKVSEKLPEYGERTRRFVGNYLRAYLLLMLLTFVELFIGFTVLSVDYSLILALIIAAIDILPALGVGVILIPWSIIELLTRDFKSGFGLLILWGVITVIRQTVEPRIVGGSLGLHPIATLVGMYVGFRVFGIVGMLAAPALTVAAKFILKEWHPQKKGV